MTAFDQAWDEIGQSCNVCGSEHYNQSDFCSKCGLTEDKLRQSGAYRRSKAETLDKVINRLILEERDRTGRLRGRGPHSIGTPNKHGQNR